MSGTLWPGSPEAREQGCICPNHPGQGKRALDCIEWLIHKDCPVHTAAWIAAGMSVPVRSLDPLKLDWELGVPLKMSDALNKPCNPEAVFDLGTVGAANAAKIQAVLDEHWQKIDGDAKTEKARLKAKLWDRDAQIEEMRQKAIEDLK